MGTPKGPEGPANPPGAERLDATYRTAALEIMWRCLSCGELWHRETPLPGACPSCGAPPEEFALVEED